MRAARARSTARLVVPQQFVQLHLEAHGQAVGDDPVGQLASIHLALARRKPHRAARMQCPVERPRTCPFVVRATAKHELDLVACAQQGQVAGAYLAERRLIRTTVFGLVLALLLTAIVKFPLAFGLPAKLNPFNRFYSNQAVVEALLSFRRDGEPLLADHYTTASLLSFYSPDHPVVTIPTTTRPSQYDIRDEKPSGVRPHGLYLTSTRQGGSLSCSELEWKCGGALFLKTLTLQAPGFQPRTFRFYRCGS